MAALRKLRTEREIQQAMEQLLLTKRFSEITVRQIVKVALINRNTFYLHYQDKFDLLSQMIDAIIERSDSQLTEFIERPFDFFADTLADLLSTGQEIIKFQERDDSFRQVVLGERKISCVNADSFM